MKTPDLSISLNVWENGKLILLAEWTNGRILLGTVQTRLTKVVTATSTQVRIAAGTVTYFTDISLVGFVQKLVLISTNIIITRPEVPPKD